MSLESIQHLVESGRQKVAGMLLLFRSRECFWQPINRVNQPLDAAFNKRLNIVLGLGCLIGCVRNTFRLRFDRMLAGKA